MKICKGCGIKKPLVNFSKHSQGKFGVRSKCKECLKLEQYNYTKSRDGVVTQIYIVQKRSCNHRNMSLPEYTKKELKTWLFNHPEFDTLYTNWVNSNYDRNLAISIDRLNDYKTYSFDNIRLTTWADNRDSRHKAVLEGRNNKQSKAVIQLTLAGNFIQEFYSIHEASRQTGSNPACIVNCCKGLQHTSNGFRWVYR